MDATCKIYLFWFSCVIDVLRGYLKTVLTLKVTKPTKKISPTMEGIVEEDIIEEAIIEEDIRISCRPITSSYLYGGHFLRYFNMCVQL